MSWSTDEAPEHEVIEVAVDRPTTDVLATRASANGPTCLVTPEVSHAPMFWFGGSPSLACRRYPNHDVLVEGEEAIQSCRPLMSASKCGRNLASAGVAAVLRRDAATAVLMFSSCVAGGLRRGRADGRICGPRGSAVEASSTPASLFEVLRRASFQNSRRAAASNNSCRSGLAKKRPRRTRAGHLPATASCCPRPGYPQAPRRAARTTRQSSASPSRAANAQNAAAAPPFSVEFQI